MSQEKIVKIFEKIDDFASKNEWKKHIIIPVKIFFTITDISIETSKLIKKNVWTNAEGENAVIISLTKASIAYILADLFWENIKESYENDIQLVSIFWENRETVVENIPIIKEEMQKIFENMNISDLIPELSFRETIEKLLNIVFTTNMASAYFAIVKKRI